MFNWKYGILLLASTMMLGCAEKVEPLPLPIIKVEKPPVAWPAPVQPTLLPSFKFENIDGKVWAMVSYRDYINFSKGQVNKERFVRDLMAALCYYQYDKTRCSNLNDK